MRAYNYGTQAEYVHNLNHTGACKWHWHLLLASFPGARKLPPIIRVPGNEANWLYAHKSNSNIMNQQKRNITLSASPIFLPTSTTGEVKVHNL